MTFTALDGGILKKETLLEEIRDRVVFVEVPPDSMKLSKSGKIID
jgi:hypothetical protein